MKIAVISDIHDNTANLQKALSWCKNQAIKEIICCGDVATKETLQQLAGYSGRIHLVFGNMDLDYQVMEKAAQQYGNLIVYGELGEIVLDNSKIVFTHEPNKIEAYLVRVKNKPEIAFYGHTHRPWEQVVSGVRLVNPGNVANMWYAPSFAWYETKTKQLGLIMINGL